MSKQLDCKKKIATGFTSLISHDYEENKTFIASIVNHKKGLNAGLANAAYRMGYPSSYVPHVVLNGKKSYT